MTDSTGRPAGRPTGWPEGTRHALFSDFDGTLADLIDDPYAARPAPGVVEALTAISESGAAVGLISGRMVTWLQRAVGLEGIVYRGLHGFERAFGLAEPEPIPELVPLADELAAVQAGLRDVAESIPGALFDDKQYAFGVHYRNVEIEGVADMVEARCREVADGHPVVLKPGKMIWEVLPDVHMDKGVALGEEIERAGADSVIFAGDDAGDVYGFDALDGLAEAGSVNGLRIAVASEGAPAELLDRADRIEGEPLALAEFLDTLVAGR